jgi:hypothetical protein
VRGAQGRQLRFHLGAATLERRTTDVESVA